MKIFLRAMDPDLGVAWCSHFENDPNVTIQVGDIFQTPVKAFVSPANSFGIMDGGIDRYYSETWGWDLGERLRAKIKRERPLGELLVGEAMTVPANKEETVFMVAAPTMRLPRKITAENVFLATRAAVYEGLSQGLEELVFPGMGTGVGAVPYDQAAQAMSYGYYAACKAFNERKFDHD